MKRFFSLAALICLCGAAWAAEPVRITFFEVPPHIFYDRSTRTVSGAVVDLLNYLTPAWGAKLVWDTAPSNIPREMEQLQKGERDAAAVFIYNPSDLDKFTYSKEAYFFARDSLLVRKDSPLQEISSIEDVLKLKIGYAPDTYLSNFMRDKRIQWENVRSSNPDELNVRNLMAGRVDAAYAPDHAALLYEMKKAAGEKTLGIVYTPEPPVPFHIGFSYKNPRIKEKFDAAFAKMNGSKKYLEFLAKYVGKQ